ncbi:MAG: hypothetical protein PW788_09395 [Micavibrio sp.]|nr:hypothetical protein [Micavibrio sp.]
MQEEDNHQPTVSRPVAYTMLAAATIGTGTLALTAPQALAAGAGSIGTSAAVFITPFWRFIKRINELYIDAATYVHEDGNMLRRKLGIAVKPPAAEAEGAAPRKHVFSRPIAYGVMAAVAVTTAGLAVMAPGVLEAAFGSVVVSGASFTKPVIDLVEKVNQVYTDLYHYVRKDLFGVKWKREELLPVEADHEIDQSIYAPVTELKKPYSRAATYGLLALGALGVGVLAVHAPAIIVAALGTIAGSAISYTSPALKMVKKLNTIYDKTENHIITDLDIADTFGVKPDANAKHANALHIPKPVAYLIAGGVAVGVAALAFYAPTVLTAALGSIAGAASSFTDPVLKQVGKVNDFYIDTCSYLRTDWQKVAGRKPVATMQPKVQLEVEPAVEKPAAITPSKTPGVRQKFNGSAAANDNDEAVNDNTIQQDTQALPAQPRKGMKPRP